MNTTPCLMLCHVTFSTEISRRRRCSSITRHEKTPESSRGVHNRPTGFCFLCCLLVSSLARQVVRSQCLHTTAVRFDTQKNEKTINQVTLLGRVGADPQKRGSEEHPVINFPLATHFNYKYESGDVMHRTDWHRISIFKPGLRDTVYKFCKKGQRVYITGKISYGEIKMDDGQVRIASSIVADDVIFFNQKIADDSQ